MGVVGEIFWDRLFVQDSPQATSADIHGRKSMFANHIFFKWTSRGFTVTKWDSSPKMKIRSWFTLSSVEHKIIYWEKLLVTKQCWVPIEFHCMDKEYSGSQREPKQFGCQISSKYFLCCTKRSTLRFDMTLGREHFYPKIKVMLFNAV